MACFATAHVAAPSAPTRVGAPRLTARRTAFASGAALRRSAPAAAVAPVHAARGDGIVTAVYEDRGDRGRGDRGTPPNIPKTSPNLISYPFHPSACACAPPVRSPTPLTEQGSMNPQPSAPHLPRNPFHPSCRISPYRR